MALEPVFRHLAVLFIPSRDQVDVVSAAPEILESLCGVFPHRYRLKDSRTRPKNSWTSPLVLLKASSM